MIKDKKYCSGKLVKLIYARDSQEWIIPVQSHFAVMVTSGVDSTAGKVLENYRSICDKNAQEGADYFDQKQGILDEFLDKLPDTRSRCFDYVQILYPSDQRRTRFLKNFSAKQFNGANDFSKNFCKNENFSIVGVRCEDAWAKFQYFAPNQLSSIRSVHIFDDTIDTGCTIGIFLDNLYDNGILNDGTEISVSIVYNNYKDNIPSKFTLEDIQNL